MWALELGRWILWPTPDWGGQWLVPAGNRNCRKNPHRGKAHVHRMVRPAVPTGTQASAPALSSTALLGRLSTEKLIAIGASTGGTEAIKEVLVQMPADAPAIIITQHMPPGFTTSFAARLNSLCQITVKEAVHGERILPGHAEIAPGGKQFAISRSGANYVAVVNDDPPVRSPQTFGRSAVQIGCPACGRNAFGIIAHRHGADGAAAMRDNEGCGQLQTMCRMRPVASSLVCPVKPSPMARL